MRPALHAGLLGGPLILLLFSAPPAAATHWCPSLDVQVAPGAAFAGDTIPFSITVTHPGPEPLDLAVQTRFGWETTTWFWGAMHLGPGATETNTFSKALTTETGDHGVRVFLSGTAQGSGEEAAFCATIQRTFRVSSLPDPPTLVAWATPTSGAAPLTVAFQSNTTGGQGALRHLWAFGDGATAEGAHANHTYQAPGQWTAQVVVTDARGRLGVDRLAIHVTPSQAAGDEAARTPAPAGAWGLVPLLIAATALTALRRRVLHGP